MRRLPLWIPDGEEGWILSFPNGVSLWFDFDVERADAYVGGTDYMERDP